jgi:hypothetical protein
MTSAEKLIKEVIKEEKSLGNKTNSKKIHTGAYSEKMNTLFVFDTKKGRENCLNNPSNRGIKALTAKQFAEINAKDDVQIRFMPF